MMVGSSHFSSLASSACSTRTLRVPSASFTGALTPATASPTISGHRSMITSMADTDAPANRSINRSSDAETRSGSRSFDPGNGSHGMAPSSRIATLVALRLCPRRRAVPSFLGHSNRTRATSLALAARPSELV